MRPSFFLRPCRMGNRKFHSTLFNMIYLSPPNIFCISQKIHKLLYFSQIKFSQKIVKMKGEKT